MNNFKAFYAFLGMLMLVSHAQAAKPYLIKVFAEPGAEGRAQEYINRIKNLEPFKQLHEQGIFVISARPEITTTTNCRGGNLGIERLAKCNTSGLAQKCTGAKLCPIFTSVPNIGAGGKPYPISSQTFPWTTMLHEVIHTFGFADEYAYTKSETGTYCGMFKKSPNEHSQPSVPVFSSEEAAIQSCISKISWCQEAVKSGSKVVHQIADGRWMWGSPLPEKCPNRKLGMFLGSSCEKKNPESTWRPYFCPNVMGFPTIGQDKCEVTERHGIISKMPGLLPTYYQKVIFDIITQEAGVRNLRFRITRESFPETYSYGIPEVDNLRLGNNSEPTVCSRAK